VTGRTRQLAIVAASGLLVAACSGDPEPATSSTSPNPVPVTVGEPAPEVDVTDLRLPFQLQGLVAVDPGWDRVPVEHDGTFLGLADDGEQLQFTAVDTEGTVLWRAERPQECTGHALSSTADGTAVVVLTGHGSDQDCTTAHAYELDTGDLVWGPVEAPGPLVGPGLTFRSADGAGHEVLAAGTGEAVPAPDGAEPVGEFHGTVLSDDGETLTATDAAGQELWAQEWPRAEDEAVGAAPDLGSPELAAVGSAQGGYDLVSLADGEVLVEGVTDLATEPATGFTVAVGGSRLQGVDAEGAPAWSVPVASGLAIHTAGGGLAYLSDGSSLQVHNVATGAVAVGYDETPGTLGTPELITVAGAGVVRTPTDLLLVTNRPAERTAPAR
jgi:hypothetical protein